MKALNLVNAKHCTDYSIVAVAMITGCSYEKVLKTMLPKRKKYTSYGASVEEIIDCFSKLKFKTRKLNKPIISKLKAHAFLVVKVPYKGERDFHAVVWDAKRKGILDSNPTPHPFSFYQKKW